MKSICVEDGPTNSTIGCYPVTPLSSAGMRVAMRLRAYRGEMRCNALAEEAGVSLHTFAASIEINSFVRRRSPSLMRNLQGRDE
jgi:hypothetical protein